MSKKNGRGIKGEETIELPNMQVAQRVAVLLPAGIETREKGNPLLEGYLRNKLNNKRVTEGQHFVVLLKGREETFSIESITATDLQAGKEPKAQREGPNSTGTYIVNSTTEIQLLPAEEEEQNEMKERKETANSFFGYEEELGDLQKSILHSLFQRQLFISNGLGPLKGILIGGYSGAGKTALLKETRSRLTFQQPSITWKFISSVELLSRVVGGAEQFIRGLFIELKAKSPCVLAIEDIHLLFGAKEVTSHETVLASLLSEMEKAEWEQIVVLATYSSDRELSKTLRSAGKFEKEVMVGLPNHSMRLGILEQMVERLALQEPMGKEQLKKINLRLNGFTAGEIKQILREAFSNWGKELTSLKLEDMLKKYRPSEIKELIVEVPEVYWKEIGGYEEAKREIRKVVELPLQHGDKFAKFGIEPSKGILLYGPPGCSKTMMAKAIATESKLNFIGIKGPELFSKYVGESERAIRNIFKRARACSPCVIFFDEIDAVATQRSGNTEVSERVLCQLLNEMDGIEGLKEVAIVAATNRPEILDKALMRPGRFDYLIYIGPPDQRARTEIFRIYLQRSVREEEVTELSELMASQTDGYTGAEISLICREAVVLALEQNLEVDKISRAELERALKRFRKRLTPFEISKFEQFGRHLRD